MNATEYQISILTAWQNGRNLELRIKGKNEDSWSKLPENKGQPYPFNFQSWDYRIATRPFTYYMVDGLFMGRYFPTFVHIEDARKFVRKEIVENEFALDEHDVDKFIHEVNGVRP